MNVMKLLVLIPTRNRTDLAMNAVLSVLAQGISEAELSLVISDNSADEDQVNQLAAFCAEKNVRVIRPPQSLAMPQHWEWAMKNALNEQITHVLYLTDRMIFKEGALRALLTIIQRHPLRIISYNHDRINDLSLPVRFEQDRWTGKLLELTSENLFFLTSQSTLHSCLPRLLNCVVPLTVLEKVRTRFGSLFDSIAPDYCFAFRSLAVEDAILYYDKTLLVHYALARSNGASAARGEASRDHDDFLKNLRDGELNAASPIPELYTVGNAIIHEYEAVRRVIGDSLPEVEMDGYLDYAAHEIAAIENPDLRNEMHSIWQQHSHRLSALSLNAVKDEASWKQSLRRKVQRVCKLARNNRHQPFYLFLKRRFGQGPTEVAAHVVEFASIGPALDFAARSWREQSSQSSDLEMVIRVRVLTCEARHSKHGS